MLFNSFSYLVFLPLVVITYFLLPNKYRWIFLLLVSYFFYMNWKPVYAILMLLSTFVTWVTALWIQSEESTRKKNPIYF